MDLGGDAQESGVVFVTVIHARDHADTQASWTLRQSCRCCDEGFDSQGVSDDCDLARRKAGGDETVGGGLRVADDGVAPAKNGGLSAELRGRHQVSKLAMAADDNGHAGKPGGGNQCEIGIEIEGVGDLNMMLAEMADQVEASAQRPPSKEAAAEGKLRSIREVVSERAATADAA